MAQVELWTEPGDYKNEVNVMPELTMTQAESRSVGQVHEELSAGCCRSS